MNRRTRRVMALNLALVAALGVVTLASATRSGAQVGAGGVQAARSRGEYALVSGKYQGSTTSAVYIVDAVNHELVALDWDRNKNRFEVIGYRSLPADAQLFRGAR